MNKMENISEFEICMDITTRMALMALAKACSEDEMGPVFAGIEIGLVEAYSDDKEDKIKEFIQQYKDATILVKKELDSLSTQEVAT